MLLRSLSLRAKLLLSHLGLIVLAMGLAGFLLLTSLERYFLDATEESLLAQARLTAQTLIPEAVTAGPPVEVQTPLYNTLQQRRSGNLAVQTENLSVPKAPTAGDVDLSYLTDSSLQIGAQLETRIRILDVEGRVLMDSDGTDLTASLQDDPLVTQALGGAYASRTIETGEARMMALALPILVDDGLAGVIYLTHPLRDVHAVLRDLRSRWLWTTAIAVVLSGAVGLMLSRAVTRPVRGLTEAAGAVAQGDLDRRVAVRTGDELGRLSRAFNEMTARLRAARQMQITFVANVSHELRTPLTSLKGMIETLQGGADEDPAIRRRFLGTMERETDRLIRLVNDLLVLTRADSEALNLQRDPLDLLHLARTTARRLEPKAEAREVTLRIPDAPDLPLVWADADRVAQVLVNLLDNAVKYSHPGGVVTVRLSAADDGTFVRTEVRDEGIGIPTGDLPQIGQRFYRADKARARDRRDVQSGSGLGLSIARALVEAHGGRLTLESEEGTGTTVRFTLPVA
jgi:signal transduction histidine kinase